MLRTSRGPRRLHLLAGHVGGPLEHLAGRPGGAQAEVRPTQAAAAASDAAAVEDGGSGGGVRLRFGMTADAHLLGRTAPKNERTLRRYVEAMRAWRPDLVVEMGDFGCQAGEAPLGLYPIVTS
jgi:hypothetical protein